MANDSFVWRPLGFSLAAYKEVLTDPAIGTGYMNTFFVVIVGTTINVFLTFISAYFLSKTGDVDNVWWCFLIAEVMSVVMSLFFMNRIYIKKIKNIPFDK